MDKKVKIESKFLLAVEGKDECNFFKALLTHLEIFAGSVAPAIYIP